MLQPKDDINELQDRLEIKEESLSNEAWDTSGGSTTKQEQRVSIAITDKYLHIS